MIQRTQDSGFVFEALQSVGVGGESGGQDFDCDGAPKARVKGFVDLAHASSANGGLNSIGPSFVPEVRGIGAQL
jgi:hypothetical protein